MHLDRTNTASVRDNDLLDVLIGKSLVHPRDLAEHIQFLRDEITEIDPELVEAFVRDVDEADDARLDAVRENAKALQTLYKLAQIARGQALELVLELQSQLHATEERLDAANVDIPMTLRGLL